MSGHCEAHLDLNVQQEANAFIGSFMDAFGSSAHLRQFGTHSKWAIGNMVQISLASMYVLTLPIGKSLTLRAPRVLVPTPSTKGGGVEKDPPVSQE